MWFCIHFLPIDPFEMIHTGPDCLRQVYKLMITSIAPLLIYHNKCQGPAWGPLKLPLNWETLFHTKYYPGGCSTLPVWVGCSLEVEGGGVFRSGGSVGLLLWANRMAANWINTLTSSEQWRSERKEGKECSTPARLVSSAAGEMKARPLKMYHDALWTCLVC